MGKDVHFNLLAVVILSVIIIAAGFLFFNANKLILSSSEKIQETTTITTTSTTTPNIYKYVTTKPTGWFKTGQQADIVLYATGFDESGGPLVLNHPGKVATDGKHLIVSDTWNNRVLIWNEIPTKNDQLPDLVLGQQDFNSNIGRLGADGMNWPMGIATDGKKLLVADANNDRILIWNAFPTRNEQPADLVLGAPDFDSWQTYLDWEGQRDEKRRINWPWDVWTDGEKVVVASTTDSSVLIWNSFPTENNQPADIILGQLNFSTRFMDMGSRKSDLVFFTTPRSISSDGKYLAVGMYGEDGAYVWKEFPTKDGQPANIVLHPRRHPDEPPMMVAGMVIKGNELYAASSHHIFVWKTLPNKTDQNPDIRLGVERLADESQLAPDKMKFFLDTFNFPVGVATDGEKLIVADTNNNRVLIFNNIPNKPDAKADVVIGKPEIYTSRRSFGSGPAPFTDGKYLFIGVDGFGTWIYKNIPDESKAGADIVLGSNAVPGYTMPVGGEVASDGKKLFMIHRDDKSRILIWNEIPTKDNQKPNIVWGGKERIGKSGMGEANSIATDGKRLFVTDTGNNRILIWNNIPTNNETSADIVLGQQDFGSSSSGNSLSQLNYPRQVSTDGKRLVVADQFNSRILVWKDIPTLNGQPADFEIKIINHSQNIADLPPSARISLPSGVFVYDNRLFLTDNGNNRILAWKEFPENETDEPDVVLGQADFVSQYRSNAKDRLFMPHYISFDGSFLWVGEGKFSNRLLRFSVS